MRKIEWFIEHPGEVEELKKQYAEESKKYALTYQVDALEQMFFDAVQEHKEGKDLHSVKPRRKDKRLLKRAHRAAKKQKEHPEILAKYYKTPSK